MNSDDKKRGLKESYPGQENSSYQGEKLEKSYNGTAKPVIRPIVMQSTVNKPKPVEDKGDKS